MVCVAVAFLGGSDTYSDGLYIIILSILLVSVGRYARWLMVVVEWWDCCRLLHLVVVMVIVIVIVMAGGGSFLERGRRY